MDPSFSYRQLPAVLVRNVTKSYSVGYHVLNHLSMTVPSGSIYGLIGASGCGKTTLLSCILGLKRTDSGWIRVFGKCPELGRSDVGYQPQEMALYTYLSVADTLTYFGRLLCMSKSEIQDRIESLSSALNLPDSSKYIRNLSGGQRRRVSLAAAILQNRKLLILDEPTAGQDPLLIESIWEQLRTLVTSNSTTIIITTHYIEEVKAADTVGFMRNGRLLLETNPAALLVKHNALLLEDVFLSLCQADEGSGHERVDRVDTTSDFLAAYKFPPIAETEPTCKSLGLMGHGRIVLALVLKNFLFLKATPLFALCVLLLPCFQLFIGLLIVGKDPKHIPMGLVNLDLLDKEKQQACSELFNTKEETHFFGQHLSCMFLDKFPSDEFTWVTYMSNEEALKGVQRGDTLGYISFPSNYSAHFRDWMIYRRFSDNETIDASTISGRLDVTLRIKSDFIQAKMFQYFSSFLNNLAGNCKQEKTMVEMPLKFHAVYGTLNSTIQTYMLPGFFVLIILAIPTGCALRFLQDRKQGTFQRSQVSGLKHWHSFLELLISEGINLALQVPLSCLILKTVGEYPGITASSLLLVYLVGAIGVGAGFLIGQAVDQELEAVYIVLGCYMPLLMGSGATQPFEGMPRWVQHIYAYSPTVQPIMSLRSISTRGWGITHPKVWPGFMVCLIYIAILFLLSAIVIKYRNRK